MFAATIALALVASVKSEIQSGPTVSQDTAPASKVQAAHKHVPIDSRRALFLHSHTPHTHVPPPLQPLPPLQPPPPPWPPGYPLPADHVLVSSTPQLRQALTGETDRQILVLRAGAHLALDGVPLSIGAGRRVRIVSDGDGPWPVFDGARLSRLFDVKGVLELEGVHLTRGNAESGGCVLVRPGGHVSVHRGLFSLCTAASTGAGAGGGALFVDAGTAELVNSTLEDCSVANRGGGYAAGGAVYARGASISLTSTTISSCAATTTGAGTAWGGAIVIVGGDLSMDGTTITECVAIASGGGRAQGGAMYTADASASVAFTTISNCNATTAGADSFGGAMEIYGGRLTLDDSTITACVANTSGDGSAYGGAVYTREASTSLTNTTISDCTALASGDGPSFGGAMMIYGGNVMLDGTTITACVASASSVGNDNHADANGGAVFIQDAQVALAHSIISDCTAVTDGEGAAYGGALHIRGGIMTLDDTTITACAAKATGVGNAYGGALFAVLASTLLTNTTISDCTALAIKEGDAWGGAMAIVGGHVMLDFTSITACVANATGPGKGLFMDESGNAHGGAMYLLSTVFDGNPLHGSSMSLTNTTISDCASTTAGSGMAFGGAMEIMGQWTVTLDDATIAACVAASGAGNAYGGAVHSPNGARLSITNTTISDCTASTAGKGTLAQGLNRLAQGGGLNIRNSSVTLHSTTITRCSARSCSGCVGLGGGLYVEDTHVLLEHGSFIEACFASEAGASLYPSEAAFVTYALPAPPGRFIAASDCTVYRASCARDLRTNEPLDPLCPLTQTKCNLLTEPNATVNGFLCQPLLPIGQPCDWFAVPGLVGRITQLLPQTPLEDDYPYPCAAGILGSAEAQGQRSSQCGGRCPAGLLCDKVVSVHPRECTLHSYCPDGSSNAIPCPDGYVGDRPGLKAASDCALCPSGHWCNSGQAFPCDVGLYAWGPAASRTTLEACRRCPVRTTTLETATPSVEGCFCQEGFLTSPSSTGGLACEPCPNGTTCGSVGTTVETLSVQSGYWRPGYFSTQARLCHYGTCANGMAASARYDRSASWTCTPERGLSGAYCRLCSEPDHYFRLGWCRSCEDVRLSLTAALISAACAVGVVAFLVWHSERWTDGASYWASIFALAQRLTLRTKLKLIISFYQTFAQLDAVYDVVYPPEFESVVRFVRTLAADMLSWLPGLHATCVGLGSLSSQLWAAITLPLALVVTMFAAARCCRGTAIAALPYVLAATFLSFVPVSSLGFRALAPCDCFEYVNNSAPTCFLLSDLAVECDSESIMSAPWSVLLPAGLAVLMYGVSVPLIFAALLWSCSDAVIGRSKPTELSRALAFLYEGLNPHVSWWVLFVLARQLVLTGFLALIEPGTLVQLYLGLIVASLSLVIEMHVSPYVDPGNRLLATVSGTSLVLAMIGLLALKMSAFLPDANVANTTKILVLLVVAALAVVGAAVAVFILESRAILAERRSMAVRRLRLQGSDKAVALAPSAPGRYHVFLSHAWVTGQDQMRVVKQRLLDILPMVHVFLDVDDAQRRVGKGAEVLNRSDKFLLFASDGFFGGIHAPSRPCMVELLKAVQLGLEMITVFEVEDKHLPLSPSQLYEQMCKLDQPVLDTNGTPVLDSHGQQFPSMYAKWGLVNGWGHVLTEDGLNPNLGALPIANRLYAKIFPPNVAPIEWNRIGVFQDISMRQIAERLLPADLHGKTYLQGELIRELPKLPPTSAGKRFHVCCSPHNAGALAYLKEVQAELRLPSLTFTNTMSELADCERFLIYLNRDTWRKSPEGFAADVERAMSANMRLLLVHESLGHESLEHDHSSARGALPFQDVLVATPQPLLARDIYHMIAIPLKAGAYRKASHVLFVQELAAQIPSSSSMVMRGWLPLHLQKLPMARAVTDVELISNSSSDQL